MKIELINFNFKEDSFLSVFQNFKKIDSNAEDSDKKFNNENVETYNTQEKEKKEKNYNHTHPWLILNQNQIHENFKELFPKIHINNTEKNKNFNLNLNDLNNLKDEDLKIVFSMTEFCRLNYCSSEKELKAFKNNIIFLIRCKKIIEEIN